MAYAKLFSPFHKFVDLLLLCVLMFGQQAHVNAYDSTTVEATTSMGGAESLRSVMARLMDRLRSLPVSQGKVPPLVTDSSGQTQVVVEATLVVGSVLAVDDVQQSMKTAGLALLRWQDEALAWNASNYSGIVVVELPLESIWAPSLFVANALVSENILNKDGTFLTVTYQGLVYARTMFIAETLCDLDLKHYPFDQQSCLLTFASSSKFVGWKVNQDNYGKSLAESYAVGAEWDLLSSTANVFHVQQYSESGVAVKIEMKRKTTFYAVCLVLPMVLTSYMNTLVFLLPLHSGEKVSFLISIFVSTSVFVSFFTTVMPRGLDSVPDTMCLLIGVIAESLIVLLATIVVLRRHSQQTTRDEDIDKRIVSAGSTRRGGFEANSPLKDKALEAWATNKDPLCAGKCQNKVSPLPGEDTLEDKLCIADKPYEARSRCPMPTAEQLDNIFFFLTVVGNTIFLAILLYQSVQA